VRPVRFVLPLNTEDSPEGENLIKLENTSAKAWLADGQVQVTAEILSELSCELPRVNNPKYTGKKYRYFYGVSFDMDSDRPGGVSIIFLI
jgi:carotenoid cleavage dioxygenase-like enzyme